MSQYVMELTIPDHAPLPELIDALERMIARARENGVMSRDLEIEKISALPEGGIAIRAAGRRT